MMTKAEAAMTYAAWGWHVLPVLPNGKVPATLHGVKDATTNAEQIAKWWAQNPDYNIGIAAGARSGIIVYDVDPRNGGEDSWADWVREHGAAPDGAMQMTAGGGQHYLANYDPDIRSCKLTEGVDLLADGRYFVAYPSTIEGRRYEWEASSDPFDGIAPFQTPAAWKAAYLNRAKTPSPGDSGNTPGLIQGSRNNGLTALGGAMRHYGMTEAEIMAALTIANETRCEIPLPASELSQIVRSVCRYEPDTDIAANAGIGYDAAEALLAASQAQTSEYHFTRATSYLSQPAPLKWVIRGWIPDSAVTMVYGESGVGKTFITLDLACHIAAGKPWHGKRTASGLVVYMAGEGNYGIRQRVAAWCKHHAFDRLDNLIISNKAIDIDSPAAAAQIIGAVREVTPDDALMVFVDTVNNHMSGDENSARDTRNMLNACQIVARALNAGICLNHHTGHGADSKGRARGSSAWKASLDSSILASKLEDGTIEISCTKMKDAEAPEPFYGKLQSVGLGWVDDEGEEITGAVFAIQNTPPQITANKPTNKLNQAISIFERAWFHSGAENRGGAPYISRSAFALWMVQNDGKSESTANKYAREAPQKGPVFDLMNAGIIQNYQHGYLVIDGVVASHLMLKN